MLAEEEAIETELVGVLPLGEMSVEDLGGHCWIEGLWLDAIGPVDEVKQPGRGHGSLLIGSRPQRRTGCAAEGLRAACAGSSVRLKGPEARVGLRSAPS